MNSKCPVQGCNNEGDPKLGLCWRCRQFVEPKLIGSIRRAVTMLDKAPTDTAVAHWRGELTKAIAAAANRSKAAREQLHAAR